MKAAWFEKFGAASECIVIGELPTPVAGNGEVLVRLKSSGVNPSDVKKRAGAFPNLLDEGLVIPHSDGAGIIEAVGGGVDPSRVGERVFVYQAQFNRRLGTAAEYVSLESSRAVPLPDQASFDVGACIGIPMMTAHRCVYTDGDVNGQTILITGGAGRVGYYAIQWAKKSSARIIATASSADDETLCRSLGAEAVVNHREPGWGDTVLELTGGVKVDRVIEVEFGANLHEVMKCIRTGGTIATYSSTQVPEPRLPFRDIMFMDLTIRTVIVYAMPEHAKRSAANDISEALTNNQFQHRLTHCVPLEQTAHAHELIEQGGFGGCVVVRIA
ncbi:MAG: zinc-binding dehydrogenase [Gammaproteobacteria bacterium]|nr:zinc-binding dehydrogenase [Gammaproteobacteria bacterium]|tara:strand:- start:324 stop:1310 length:987 start_codon:yes stop_codon:yes gene_type:complete